MPDQEQDPYAAIAKPSASNSAVATSDDPYATIATPVKAISPPPVPTQPAQGGPAPIKYDNTFEAIAHGFGIPTSVSEIEQRAQEEAQHPVRSAVERLADPTGLLRGAISTAKDTSGEVKQAIQSAHEGDPYGAIAHGVSAIPIVGPIIRNEAERAPATPNEARLAVMTDQEKQDLKQQQDAYGNEVVGSVLAGAAQTAPIVAGGFEGLRNLRVGSRPPGAPPSGSGLNAVRTRLSSKGLPTSPEATPTPSPAAAPLPYNLQAASDALSGKPLGTPPTVPEAVAPTPTLRPPAQTAPSPGPVPTEIPQSIGQGIPRAPTVAHPVRPTGEVLASYPDALYDLYTAARQHGTPPDLVAYELNLKPEELAGIEQRYNGPGGPGAPPPPPKPIVGGPLTVQGKPPTEPFSLGGTTDPEQLFRMYEMRLDVGEHPADVADTLELTDEQQYDFLHRYFSKESPEGTAPKAPEEEQGGNGRSQGSPERAPGSGGGQSSSSPEEAEPSSSGRTATAVMEPEVVPEEAEEEAAKAEPKPATQAGATGKPPTEQAPTAAPAAPVEPPPEPDQVSPTGTPASAIPPHLSAYVAALAANRKPGKQTHAPVAPTDAPKPLQPATADATNQPQPVGKEEPATGRQIVQATDNPATLQKAAKANAPWLDQAVNATVKGVQGASVGGIRDKKEPADLGEKLNQEGQPAETIPDYLGGRIVVDSPAARDQVVAKIRQTMKVVTEKDNFEKGSDPYGFRTHTFQVQTPDGNTAELQVVPKEMAEVNDQTHPDYEKAERARLAGNQPEHEQLAQGVRAVHDQAMGKFNQRNGIQTQGGGGGAQPEANPQTPGAAQAQAQPATPFTPKKGDRVLMGDAWVRQHIGQPLPISNSKDDNEAYILDDHANVAPNVNEPMQIPPIPKGKWLAVDIDKTLAYAHTGEKGNAEPRISGQSPAVTAPEGSGNVPQKEEKAGAKPVEKPVEQEDNKPSTEVSHEPESGREAGGGRPSADTGSADRAGVAEESPRVREESGEGKPSESTSERDGAGVREVSAPVRRARTRSGPSEGSAASLDLSPAEPVVEAANKQQRKRTKLNQEWFQHPEDWQVPGGQITRLDNNIAALEILRDVQKNPRKVTDEEKTKLSNYIGWGSLSKVFDENYLRKSPWENSTETGEKRRWRDAHAKLEELLTPEEYDAARRSTQNAHYTPPDLVRFMWSAVQRMGFKSGNVLEPSIGVGNFFGMMPAEIRANVNGVADELDPITHGIAQLLYPGATIFNKDFVELIMPDNDIDLAIGNVPFGEAVYDPKYPKMKARIHDYFFVKSLDKVKPGGMVAFITSTGTMDKVSPAIRHILASQADLVTAFRLPSSAFKANAGTEVTTDLIFLRKRMPDEKPAGEPWIASSPIEIPVDDEDRTHPLSINEFYQKHPENMLGNPVASGRMYGGLNFMLNPSDTPIDELLKNALASIPKGVLGSASVSRPSGLDMPSTDAAYAPDSLKEYQYTVDKGKLKQRVQGKLVQPKSVIDKNGVINAAKVDRIKAMVDLRDQLNALMAAMATMPDDDVSNELIGIQRAKLHKSYNSFVKQYGYLNSTYNGLFREDPHYPRLLALENYDKAKKKGNPADIFKKRTIFPRQPLRAVSDDPQEALQQILSERGYPDINLMAQLQGKNPKDVAASLSKSGLVFRDPVSGEYETREKYLSGYVRDKLDDARKAVAQGSDEYKPNVTALEKVQPADLEISDDVETSISVRLGGTWIPIPALEDFFEQTFKSSADIGYAGGTWNVEARSKWTPEIVTEWAGGGVKADELFQLSLNQKQPTVYFPKNSDGSGGGMDTQNTTAARAMQERIRQEFQKWAGKSKEWKAPLEKAYNYAFNNLVTTDYDGSHLTFPGKNPDITLKAHQVNAVWRMLQDGKALLAHEVGAGKTFDMVAAVMEGKRVGLFKKPMLAVPNHIVDQFRKEFLLLYPGANILVPTEKDFDSKNRQRIMSQIATGDYDAIILPHSQFNLMDISPERQLITIEKQMDELTETLSAMKKVAGKRDRSVKELEKAKEKLRAKIAELRNLRADNAINFDDTGVDALFVDEAHEYKNLAFYTKMTRIAGIQQGNAKRALRLKMKTEYLQDKNKGRGVYFATGTPVQNTMAELYTQIKYVDPEVLEKAGIRFFDDWAANFGSTITAMELSADGRSFKARTKFARFQNVPELMQMFRSFADVKTAADLNLPRPDLEGGKPIVITVPGSELLDHYVQDLMNRAAHLPADPKEDNMLKIVSEGRKAATDLRLLDQEIADERDSKINVAVRQILREWEEGKDDKTTQMVFLDMYRATDAADRELINLYGDMRKKLIAAGVPAHEVAIIGEHNTRLKRQALFDKMNTGEVRILLGSTQKMGSGTNAQQKMKALHHIDLTWRPGDLTQREGRILRQGNDNKTVRIYNYLTERSFDAYMAQTLQSKAEFLSQILSGRAKGRTALDAAADMVLSLEEMKVAASGNPDIKKKYDLEMRRSQLHSLEREFAAKQREVKWRAESAENSAINARTRVKVLEKIQAKIETIRGKDGEGFELEVDGKKFTDTKSATEYLEKMELPPGTFWMKVNDVNVAVKPRVENYLGGKAEDGKTTHIEYALEYENKEHTIPEQTMVSLSRSISARLREIPSDIRRSQSIAERDDEEAKRYRTQLEKKDFPEKDELEKVENDLREVETRLGLGNINTGSQATGEEAQADVGAETPDVEPVETDEEEEDEQDEPEPLAPKPDKRISDIEGTVSAFGFANPAIFAKLFPDLSKRITDWASEAPTAGSQQKELMREKAGEMDRRVAIAVYQLRKDSKEWRSRDRQESINFWNAVEKGDLSRLPAKDQQLAQIFKSAFDSMRGDLQDLNPGMLRNYIENYFPHIWERPSHASKMIRGMLTGKRPFAGKASFLKKRTIPTMQDGFNLGFTPVSWNPVDLFLLKYSEMAQFLMAHQTLDVMKKSGSAKFVRGMKTGPDGWVQLDDRISAVWRRATLIDEDKVDDATYMHTYPGSKTQIPSIAIEDLEDAEYNGMVVVGHYYAPAEAAKAFNAYVSKGFAGRSSIYDAARCLNGTINTLQLGISAFHATMITGIGAASDTALGIQQLTEGKPISFAAHVGMGILFPISTINTVRNGMKLMRSYLDPVKYPEMAKEAESIATAGGRLKENTVKIKALDAAINAFSNRAYGKGLSAIPSAILQTLTGPIMEHYVPIMKLGVFYGLAHNIFDEQSKGKITGAQVRTRLDEAWNSVDNRGGQMVLRNLFWHRSILDVLQVATRSVGWNYGTFYEAFGAVTGAAKAAVQTLRGKKPRLTPSMAFALALPLMVGMMGGAANYLRTGHTPDNYKDYFYIHQADGTYLAPPTYMKDVFSYANNPLSTIGHKMGPLAEATFELLQNKDFYGTEIRHKDDGIMLQLAEVAEWAAKQTIPFSFSSAGKLLERQGAQETLKSMLQEGRKHPTDIIAGQLGFTAAPAYIQNSDALNMARQYGQENRPAGTKTKADADRTHAMHVVEDMYRKKTVDKKAIAAYKKNGILSDVDVLRARLDSRSTPLLPAVQPLSPEQALNVYKAGTADEKKELRPLIEFKGRELNKIEDPEQRDKLKKAYHDALKLRPTFTAPTKPGTA